MALERVPIPSPNYSSSRPRSRLLVVHTSEGATTFRSLGNFLANPAAEVSYHAGFDDSTATSIGVYVTHDAKSWSAHSANAEGQHGCCCTPSGASSGWSRQDWLARPRMLDACARWLEEEATRYGVPLRKIGPDEIRAGGSGVCGHADCVQAGLGGSHTDPGPNFPWDYVLGGATTEPPEEEVPDMWTISGLVPSGTRDQPGVLILGLPWGRETARVDLYTTAPPAQGVSCWAAQCLEGKKHGLWSGGNVWEVWLTGSKLFAADLSGSVRALEVHHQGGTPAPLAVTISGT